MKKACLLILLFIVSNIAAQQSEVISQGNLVTLAIGSQKVEVRMFSTEPSLAGIHLSMVEIGDSFLGIESTDPQNRYLPNVHIMPRNLSGTQSAVLLQAPRGQGWRFRQIGTADLKTFILNVIGPSTPKTLHTDLDLIYGDNAPLNILMPLAPEDSLMLYSTPLASTAIVVPQSLIDPITQLPTAAIPDVIVFHALGLKASPYTLLDSARTATVPNLGVNDANIPGDLNNALEFAASDSPFGFRYNVVSAMCDGQFSQITAQNPLPGEVINALETPVEVTVCAGARGQVAYTTSLNVRRWPGLNISNLLTTLPANTEVMVMGRSTDNVWYKIRLSDGQEAWASADFIQTNVSRDTLPVIDAPIINFIADSYNITTGGCVTVSWRVANASQITYRGTVVDSNGSVFECPAGPVTYTLSVTDEGQLLEAAIYIQVSNVGY